MNLIKTLMGAALVSSAIATGAFASESITEAQRSQITEKLTAEGYEVRKIEMEDGEVEVYALKEGKKVELYLDADLNIARVKEAD